MELLKLTPKEFARIAKIIYDRVGIHLPEEKLSLLSNRLRNRLKALNLSSFVEYENVLNDAEKYEVELPFFLSAVTTNETYFFRNDKLWEFFRRDLIPYLVKIKCEKDRAIRVWSAASSSGEEAYTVAIALSEALIPLESWKIQIVGSDVSRKVLDKARAAEYAEYAVHKMTPGQIRRWFTKTENSFQPKPDIRKLVEFRFHNLRDRFKGGSFDVVLLRNVLMYFDNEMKRRAVEVVSEALRPAGILIIGDVDPIRTIAELSAAMPCEYQRPGVYQKPGGNVPRLTEMAKVTA